MKKIYIQYYKTKVGEVILGSFDNKLCMLDWRYRKRRTAIDNRISKALKSEYLLQGSDVIEKTINQLNEYLSSNRLKFDVPLLMIGTPFQKSVWHGLLNVPYGKTSSYLQLAKSINHEKAVRAVGSANGANAISILIPCHRIIASDGKLAGYAGGLSAKKHLLKLEQDNINSLFSN